MAHASWRPTYSGEADGSNVTTLNARPSRNRTYGSPRARAARSSCSSWENIDGLPAGRRTGSVTLAIVTPNSASRTTLGEGPRQPGAGAFGAGGNAGGGTGAITTGGGVTIT